MPTRSSLWKDRFTLVHCVRGFLCITAGKTWQQAARPDHGLSILSPVWLRLGTELTPHHAPHTLPALTAFLAAADQRNMNTNRICLLSPRALLRVCRIMGDVQIPLRSIPSKTFVLTFFCLSVCVYIYACVCICVCLCVYMYCVCTCEYLCVCCIYMCS